MKLLIVGAGGYGHLVKEIAELTGRYGQIDFLDDANENAVGKLCELKNIQESYDGCVVAIGNPVVREKVFREMERPVSVIHPDAVISNSAEIGKGCVIEAGTVINTGAKIKDCTYICAGAVVNHNAVVSEFCQIDCNAVVSSGTCVPEGTKLESCSVWKQRL